MEPLARMRGHGRELAILSAGLGAALALLWAGATIQGNVSTAGAVAVARLSGEVADTVVAEWERLLRDPEFPVEPAGEVFTWKPGEPALEPLELRERWEPMEPEAPTVFDTLLAEAERRELVEEDPRAALGLVLDALAAEPEALHRPEGLLRAIQLGGRLGETEIARTHFELVRKELDPRDAREGLPYECLSWFALPAGVSREVPAAALFSGDDLARFALDEDRILLGAPEVRPEVRFELSPTLEVLLERLRLEPPPLEARKARALARSAGALPAVEEDGLWHPFDWAGRPFLARSSAGTVEGFFHAPDALAGALARRARLPDGFQLDFRGEEESAGPAVRPRARLPGSELAFVLRHADPERIARDESTRLAALRSALFVLAFFCAAGGFVTARVLSRERKLAELKSAFVAGVSHDLRTPLASILLMAENLEAGRVSEENRARYHQTLRREAERLRRLIDGVLDFSRFERGVEADLRPEELDLPRFLDELARASRERVEEAGGTFALATNAVPPTATLDPLALRRAVANLVDNALKHGGGEVRLGWEADASHLKLSVGDRGPGVPPARAAAIFRPFERFPVGPGAPGGSAERGGPRGLGLGLAIVRSIARGHGGGVSVRSGQNGPGEDGRGATFEIVIPLEATSP